MRLVERKPRPVAEGDVLPLINVVFLLLIFFLLAGRLVQPEPATVSPPAVEGGETYIDEAVTVTIAAEGALTLNGEPGTLSSLHEALVGEPEPPPVVIKADAAVSAATLLELLDVLRRAGVSDLSLLARASP